MVDLLLATGHLKTGFYSGVVLKDILKYGAGTSYDKKNVKKKLLIQAYLSFEYVAVKFSVYKLHCVNSARDHSSVSCVHF